MTSMPHAAMALARAVRDHDPAAEADARRELAAAKIEKYVQKCLEQAPPLSTEQLTRLAELLRPARGGGAR